MTSDVWFIITRNYLRPPCRLPLPFWPGTLSGDGGKILLSLVFDFQIKNAIASMTTPPAM